MDTAAKFQIIVQGDNGDELWEVDSDYALTRDAARRRARSKLAGNRVMLDPGVTLTAYIYKGQMVNIGDEEIDDWIFEADSTVDTEVIS